MKEINTILKEIYIALNDQSLQSGLQRTLKNLLPASYRVLKRWPYLIKLADEVRRIREETLKNLDYYIDETIKNVELIHGKGYFAKDRYEVIKIIDEIIGNDKKLIVKAKSMVTEELKIREHLIEKGHIVYETDLGEFLIQISKDKPMHAIAPAIHISKEKAVKLLKSIGCHVSEEMSYEDIVKGVRVFLREKFINADIGISGANVVAADSGATILISNEGNIRLSTILPPIHIAIASIEKIVPTINDAYKQALVQAGYAGLYPPTYLSLTAGPSSTADIEYYRVYGVHGPREFHLILYDGGRSNAIKNQYLWEQLLCIKCGRCQAECPIWNLVANVWGGNVYGGPMGIIWTAITEDIETAAQLSLLCLGCGRCKEVCPMKINMPSIIRHLKTHVSKPVT